MTDIHNRETRSYNMSQIKGSNTKPELVLRKLLFRAGFRYRLHVKNLPGKPDIVLEKYKTVIFVNGCFWHGHENCRYFKLPATRTAWWDAKINATKKRDHNNSKLLSKIGWKIITVWECSLKKEKDRNNIMEKIKNQLTL